MEFEHDTEIDRVLGQRLKAARQRHGLTLDALAELLASRVETNGVIALSGILDGQDTELLLRYTRWFDELAVAKQGDWVRITGRRNAKT